MRLDITRITGNPPLLLLGHSKDRHQAPTTFPLAAFGGFQFLGNAFVFHAQAFFLVASRFCSVV